MISEILIYLYGTKHQLFHRWNMICVWNTPLKLESLSRPYSSKTREPHLLQSLQTGSYKYSSSECNEVLDALLTPKKAAGILCEFSPSGKKLTSRAVHMRNIFRSVGREKPWWGLQNNSASHYCQSHHSQSVHAPQANSPPSHTTVPSFVQ